ncbi:beta-galactosidase, partial [Bacillaceae bacterium Marseille-Q3522]|nr:beta-galactosidase [Bacillaceae bacterium Marseille-Q3522]
MVEIKNKQIIIDGKPQLIISGEIHYYRIPREKWQDRITKLKSAGFNTVSTYIPWLCHEPLEGEIDFEGSTRASLNLGAFIDLCQENRLFFILRPGPLIMAEMKNEGLPYWLYTKYPDAIPVGWDGKKTTTSVLDYLHHGILKETKHWYQKVMEIALPRLHENGGNIIGIQLDNEIGMLQWVSNTPDLTQGVLEDFRKWLYEKYDAKMLLKRYPFLIDNQHFFMNCIRSPKEDYVLELMSDLGYFMRHRFTKFVAVLKKMMDELGVKDTPYIINVHGSDQGRAKMFPLGISQLFEAYTQDEQIIAGSDHYIGDLTADKFQDIYLMNAYMEAVNLENQPLSCMEMQCGDGDHGLVFGEHHFDVSTSDIKTRVSIAQGNRIINHYLFTGGVNYLMNFPLNDGNDRISFTGEHHGMGSILDSTGKPDYTYFRLSKINKILLASADKIASCSEERDNIAFAFIPDYFMTEYHYPKSKKMKEVIHDLEFHRAGYAWDTVGRAMIAAGFRFSALDIQNQAFTKSDIRTLIVPTAKFMAKIVQEKLVKYILNGGNVLFYGELPIFDLEANPCTVLIDAIGVEVIGRRDTILPYYLFVSSVNWANNLPDICVHYVQEYKGMNLEPLLIAYDSKEICGFEKQVGEGKVIAIGTTYDYNVLFFKEILKRLGAVPGLSHDNEDYGIFLTTTINEKGEKFLHIINLDHFHKELRIQYDGEMLFEGRTITIHSNDCMMLPINAVYKDIEILYSTAEVAKVSDEAIEFRLTQPRDVILLKTNKEVEASNDYVASWNSDNTILIQSLKHSLVDDFL